MNTKPRKKDKKLHLSGWTFFKFSVRDQNSLMVWVSLVSIIVTGIWINSSAGLMIARFFGFLDINMKHGIFLPVHINTALTLKYTLLRPLSYMSYNSNAAKTCE